MRKVGRSYVKAFKCLTRTHTLKMLQKDLEK